MSINSIMILGSQESRSNLLSYWQCSTNTGSVLGICSIAPKLPRFPLGCPAPTAELKSYKWASRKETICTSWLGGYMSYLELGRSVIQNPGQVETSVVHAISAALSGLPVGLIHVEFGLEAFELRRHSKCYMIYP